MLAKYGRAPLVLLAVGFALLAILHTIGGTAAVVGTVMAVALLGVAALYHLTQRQPVIATAAGFAAVGAGWQVAQQLTTIAV